MPPVSKIQKIADYFRIGKTYLTDDIPAAGDEDEFSVICAKIIKQDKRFRDIIIDYYKMTVDEKNALCEFWQIFIKKGGG